ncbi:MAG: hypothetical protein IPH05_03515 [Flavobacteriales bacterium]|nr:hypothetical protein [Flavobacteriales bacterium]
MTRPRCRINAKNAHGLGTNAGWSRLQFSFVLVGLDALLKAQSVPQDPSASVVGRTALLAELEELRGTVRTREALAVQLGLTRVEPFAVRAACVGSGTSVDAGSHDDRSARCRAART